MLDIQDVIEALQYYAEKCEELGVDPSLKLVNQPSYPMSSGVQGITISNDGSLLLGMQHMEYECKSDTEGAWSGEVLIDENWHKVEGGEDE